MVLFLTVTPYHLILAHAIIAQNNIKKAFILHTDEADFLSYIPNIDEIFYPHTFISFTGFKNRLERALYMRKRCREFKKVLEKFDLLSKVKKIFFFNDAQAYVQYVLTKIGNNATNYYVEDGSEVYNCYDRGDGLSFKEQFVSFTKKVLFGTHYKNVIYYGTYRKCDGVYVLFPNIVRDGLKDKALIKIEEKNFRDAVDKYLETIVVDKSIYRDLDYVVVIARLSGVDEVFFKKIEKVFANIRKHKPNANIAVKPHPFHYYEYNNNPKIINLFHSHSVKVLHPSIPIEIIYAACADKAHLVLTYLTTSVFTSLSYKPDRTIILLNRFCLEPYYSVNKLEYLGKVVFVDEL